MKVNLTKKDGVVSMEKPFAYLCSQLRNGEYTLTIKRKTSPRTISQNRLMWLWFQCMEDSTGQPKEDWHAYFCATLLAQPKEMKKGSPPVMIPGRTSELDTARFTEFLEKVQAEAATEFGITLPLPSDRFFGDFIDEYDT